MKLYKDSERKSWSIRLVEKPNTSVYLYAVDSDSGEPIMPLLNFDMNGNIVRMLYVKRKLIAKGYDPYEHNNMFDELDRIIIT